MFKISSLTPRSTSRRVMMLFLACVCVKMAATHARSVWVYICIAFVGVMLIRCCEAPFSSWHTHDDVCSGMFDALPVFRWLMKDTFQDFWWNNSAVLCSTVFSLSLPLSLCYPDLLMLLVAAKSSDNRRVAPASGMGRRKASTKLTYFVYR